MSDEKKEQLLIKWTNANHFLGRRIVARFLDYLFLLIGGFIWFCIVINKNLNNFFINIFQFELAMWQLFLIAIGLFFINLLFFVLIPYWCNGYTIGKIICKIKIIKFNENQYQSFDAISFWSLFKRELFWTIIILGLFCIYAISVWIQQKALNTSLSEYWKNAFVNTDNNWILIIYSGFNVGFIFVTVAVICTTIFSKNKKGVHEKFSNTALAIKIERQYTNDKKQFFQDQKDQNKVDVDLPGFFNRSKYQELKKMIEEHDKH